MENYFLNSIAFVFGLCIGSFLNVCIYRLPEEISIMSPGSRCAACSKPIAFYDNIPIFSYLILRGRCRHCNTSISYRYPVVELITGLLALGIFIRFGFNPVAVVLLIFSAALIVVTFIDLDHRIIPDLITLPGIPLFFAASFLFPHSNLMEPMIRSLLGILSGGGSLFLVAWIYERLTGKEGMGMGDVKLLAMIGALIGWRGVLFTIFAGSSVGCIVGLVLMLKNREGLKMALPFGPFLSLGALLFVFWGSRIINWYLHLLK